jgi:hypothetical protein
MIAIDHYAEAALGNREYFVNRPHGIGHARTRSLVQRRPSEWA